MTAMKTFLCTLLVFLSFVSYFMLSRVTSYIHYHPIAHYVGMVVGMFLLIYLMVSKFTKLRMAALIFSIFIICFTFWYTTSFSQYKDTNASVSLGDSAGSMLNQITLVSTSGESIKLGTVIKKNRATLIVFSRAQW